MMKTESQLYSRVKGLYIPDSAIKFNNRSAAKINYQFLPLTAFVHWPNRKPCIPINMYLLDNGYKWTGESAITYASELSELVRYCAYTNKNFSELNDSDIFSLINKLRSDICVNDPHQRVRNDNTVRRILQRSLDFLDWYQRNIYNGNIPLLGERSESPLIVCSKKKNVHSGRYYWTHRYSPEAVSTEPKPAISLDVIENIEEVIERLGDPVAYPEPASRRFNNQKNLYLEMLDYLYARRKFMVWIMKRTGLRAGEMVQMPLSENMNILSKRTLTLPTLKRRHLMPPLRDFPITPKDGRTVLRYFSARSKWIKACSVNPNYLDPKTMFLSAEASRLGQPISKKGLEKDFERLCNQAGYRDQQVCFSMFRHRFITYEVLYHLKLFEQQKGPITTDQDYRTILERVRAKTGHKSVDSLWHYIDLARKLDNVWANIDKSINRLHAGEHLKLDLEYLRRDLRSTDPSDFTPEQLLDYIYYNLESIIREGRLAGIAFENGN